MRRLLSIPVVEIVLFSAVGFCSLGICLAIDEFQAVVRRHADEEAGWAFIDNNSSYSQESKKDAGNDMQTNVVSGLTAR